MWVETRFIEFLQKCCKHLLRISCRFAGKVCEVD